MPELDFKGKEFVRNHHLTVPYRPLVPDASKSVGESDLDGNLIIHGDNLEALKALLPKYAGKVDCVFIDPPYNTGNEGWCYNDNVNSPMMRAWFSENPVGLDDGLRHDKWCCMMWPRLKLLWELLAETGSFWMTLDDNEVHRGRMLLDEVFGDQNHVVTIAWQKRTSPESRKTIASAHDHILLYSKGHPKSDLVLYRRGDDRGENAFANPDQDLRGPWSSSDMTAQGFRKNQMYVVVTPAGTEYEPPKGRCWGMLESEYLALRADNRIWYGASGNARPRVKHFIRESDGLSDWTWWRHQEAGTNEASKKQINDILELDTPFDTPKPVDLVIRILGLAVAAQDSLVLDSFAGSGTTAHAVLKLNAEDGGNRKFILVECEDYADTVTAERVRRVIAGYPFQGTQRETLFEKRLTWTEIKRGDALREEAEQSKRFAEAEGGWDAVRVTVDDGVLKVVGERRVAETAPGLGGSFTYCTLGSPLRLEAMLSGGDLPSRETLGDWLLYVAASVGETEQAPRVPEDLAPLFLARRSGVCYWLLYRPDLDWLKSREAALTLDLARAIAKVDPVAEHRVLGPQKFVSNKLLCAEGLRIEFAPIPFALFRRGAE